MWSYLVPHEQSTLCLDRKLLQTLGLLQLLLQLKFGLTALTFFGCFLLFILENLQSKPDKVLNITKDAFFSILVNRLWHTSLS